MKALKLQLINATTIEKRKYTSDRDEVKQPTDVYCALNASPYLAQVGLDVSKLSGWKPQSRLTLTMKRKAR